MSKSIEMSDIFQSVAGGPSARAASPVPSEYAGEEYGEYPGRAKSGRLAGKGVAGSSGVFRKDGGAGAALKGRAPVGYDSRKFRYDVVRGKGVNLGFETSREDRMSAEEAGDMLNRIHVLSGVERETEGIIRAFDKALFFCHTVNGGSVLMPGRAKFSVPGVTQEFNYGHIRDLLGVAMRRFFRAFADEIADANLEVLRDYDQYDAVRAEQWGWLMQTAYDRGMQRYPHLSHDSADACLNLAPAERAALAASKLMVVSTSNNSADRMKANSRVSSADGYDSTVGEVTAQR